MKVSHNAFETYYPILLSSRKLYFVFIICAYLLSLLSPGIKSNASFLYVSMKNSGHTDIYIIMD